MNRCDGNTLTAFRLPNAMHKKENGIIIYIKTYEKRVVNGCNTFKIILPCGVRADLDREWLGRRRRSSDTDTSDEPLEATFITETKGE